MAAFLRTLPELAAIAAHDPFVGVSVLRPEVITSEFKVNHLRPGRGSRLIARARVVHAGARQAVCACEVWAASNEEALYAAAQGTIGTYSAAARSAKPGSE
ncbi:MAG: PaaI family thioesterase [Anaerolineales bacterium]|nr:PaaI family thioesterase [Anaerolineales bacterium]